MNNSAEMRPQYIYPARYLLLAFERHRRRIRNPSIISQEDLAQYEILHVLPRSAAGVWPSFEEQDLASWSKRLGNSVLLQRFA